MSMNVRVTKRGEVWSCCSAWQYGDDCGCEPYVVEFYDSITGAEIHAKDEGPRRAPSRGGS